MRVILILDILPDFCVVSACDTALMPESINVLCNLVWVTPHQTNHRPHAAGPCGLPAAGWRFNGEGACTVIPQIADPKAQAVACASTRSAVKSFPTKVCPLLQGVQAARDPCSRGKVMCFPCEHTTCVLPCLVTVRSIEHMQPLYSNGADAECKQDRAQKEAQPEE